jgi:hypothetical protein
MDRVCCIVENTQKPVDHAHGFVQFVIFSFFFPMAFEKGTVCQVLLLVW